MTEENIRQQSITFCDLFDGIIAGKQLQGISIPMIQRDYAQGRPSQKKIRTSFLQALRNAIINKPITLDFIYGSIGNDGILIPLDGQQRLTTLFLLHLYAAWKDGISKEKYRFLTSFRYKTRPSADNFCKTLVEEFVPSGKALISEQIKDQAWFPLDWNNDPTISSMITMLDDISLNFSNIDNLWNKLTEERRITFYFIGIEKMGLTDDIYIKMNSRGKPLTSFEHFKAEFNRIVEDKSISLKIDTTWTDMLWPYRGEEGKPFEGDNAVIDDEFERYFHYLTDIICFRKGMSLLKDPFTMVNVIYTDEDNLRFMESCFDSWSKMDIGALFKNTFSGQVYEKGKVKIYDYPCNLFLDCCKHYGNRQLFGYNKMLLLYAVLLRFTMVRQTVRHDASPIDDAIFQLRLRKIRNLVWNTYIDVNEMPKLLKGVEELMLAGNLSDEYFSRYQVAEEIEKQEWCQHHSEEEQEELFHTEDHAMLYGSIRILGLENVSLFPAFRKLFNGDTSRLLIHRAMLSIGNYGQSQRWKRYQFGANNYSVWQSLFHQSQQTGRFEETKNVLTRLLQRLDLNEDLSVQLQQIIDSYLDSAPKDWRYYMVNYPIIGERSNFGMYYWYDESKEYEEIVMRTEVSLGGKHWNVTLLAISHLLQQEWENGVISHGEYNAPIVVLTPHDTLEVSCKNDCFLINRKGSDETRVVQIPQQDGCDTADRVLMGVDIIKQLLSEQIAF